MLRLWNQARGNGNDQRVCIEFVTEDVLMRLTAAAFGVVLVPLCLLLRRQICWKMSTATVTELKGFAVAAPLAGFPPIGNENPAVPPKLKMRKRVGINRHLRAVG